MLEGTLNRTGFDAAVFFEKDSEYAQEFSPEVRDRAVRMVLYRLPEYPSVNAACKVVAPKLGIGTESLLSTPLGDPDPG
ncbi:hypothetical protein [Arthrobacter sp. N199823]|uniref:hypothetical protein n=1 Tax=Arthrobacter sp. N199823 TaxID=2058895 RepID=UPI000CE37DF3|nr:hypothetical protein [Arthrobacter sp. N199823]